MQLADSGKREEFASGAVRDAGTDDRGRCDLLPLQQIAELLDDDVVLPWIDKFEKTKDVKYLKESIGEIIFQEYDNCAETAVLHLSLHFKRGAEKYTASNWAKGINVHNFVDSAIRHWLKYRRGDTDEDVVDGESTHLVACMWNLLCCWWTMENHPELMDLETVYDI